MVFHSKNWLLCIFIADIALVTPLRDGMNLVAKEYVAVKQDNPGVLVLSEMAGAAVELTDALLVNPNDTEQIENAICRALECRLKNSKNGCTVCSLLYPYRLSINGLPIL